MKKKLFAYSLLFLIILPIFASAGFESIGDGKVKVPNPLMGQAGPADEPKFGGLVTNVLNVALAVVGSIAVIFLVYGGFRYVTAHGNEEQAEAAKKIIQQSILGLIIVVLAFAIITIITNALIGGRGGV